MYLQIITNNIDSLYLKSLTYFEKEYRNNFQSKESLVARYLISKEVEKQFGIKNYQPKNDENRKPIFENNIFWSISHKDNLIFICVDKKPITVDIETYKERDESLLDTFTEQEYSLLGGKNWNNFYTLWTIKESILKLFQSDSLDMMKDIHILKVEKNELQINGIQFTTFFTSNFGEKKVSSQSGTRDNLIYSISTR